MRRPLIQVHTTVHVHILNNEQTFSNETSSVTIKILFESIVRTCFIAKTLLFDIQFETVKIFRSFKRGKRFGAIGKL